MKELIEITNAFEALIAEGKPAALATVIGVEGSAYRRPGARMLIAEDGRTWGGVSGGCIDRDVAARGRRAITTGQPQRCRYDPNDEDGLQGGVTTGCGGVVELFIQPVSQESPGPLLAIAWALRERNPQVVHTRLVARQESAVDVRDCIAVSDEANPNDTAKCAWTSRDVEGNEWFSQRIVPPQALVIFGNGPDVTPVLSIAKTLGWHVTIVAARPGTSLRERFSIADALHLTSTDAPCAGVEIARDAAVVVMTHNLERDASILQNLPDSLAYVGLLGPRHRTRQILDEVSDGQEREELFSPIGLDLGGDTPEEIALSIMAEIQSVLRKGSAASSSLRESCEPIHRQRSEKRASKYLFPERPRTTCPA